MFPDVTPYHYTHNNPINRIDLDGKDDAHFFTASQRQKLWDNLANSAKTWERNFIMKKGPNGLDALSLLSVPFTPLSSAFAFTSAGWSSLNSYNNGEFENIDGFMSFGTAGFSQIFAKTWKGRAAYAAAQLYYDATLSGSTIQDVLNQDNSLNNTLYDKNNAGVNVLYEDGYYNVEVETQDQASEEASRWYSLGYTVYIDGELYEP